jgi:hypothetical protein
VSSLDWRSLNTDFCSQNIDCIIFVSVFAVGVVVADNRPTFVDLIRSVAAYIVQAVAVVVVAFGLVTV